MKVRFFYTETKEFGKIYQIAEFKRDPNMSIQHIVRGHTCGLRLDSFTFMPDGDLHLFFVDNPKL